MTSCRKALNKGVVVAALIVLFLSASIAAQQKPPAVAAPARTKAPAVTQIDLAGLRKELNASDKPLLVNFWATWCDPCREEFPDLVKLDAEYKGKIDFITITLDDAEELTRGVPKFLTEMKAEMPTFLLVSGDDDAAIAAVSKDFTGALPFTILYDGSGKQAYFRQGKVRLDILKAEIDKLVAPAPAKATTQK